jgi:hypothetical protein
MAVSTVSTVNMYLLNSGTHEVVPIDHNIALETNQVFPYDGNGVDGELKTTLTTTKPSKTIHSFSLSSYSTSKNGDYVLRSSSAVGVNWVQMDAQLMFTSPVGMNYTGVFMFGRTIANPTWNGFYNDSNVFKTYTQYPYNVLTYLGGGTGFFYTTVYDLGSVNGEWVQIKFPYKARIKSISIKPVYGNYVYGPRAGKVLGSDDEETWFYIGDYSSASTPSNVFYKSEFVSNVKRFQYIRFVVTGSGSAGCSIGWLKYELDIYSLLADTQ